MTDTPTKSKTTTPLPKIAELLGKGAKPAVSPDDLHVPDVVGFYMLVALPEKTEKKGSIYMPDEVAEAERAATVIGHVISQGEDAYKGVYPNGLPRFPSGPWCKTGDYVVMGRYTGHRIRVGGVEFRILADDQILAVLDEKARTEVTGL